MIEDKVDIVKRVALLKERAAERCHVEVEDCHIGHVALQSLLDEPDKIHQIDAATGGSETNRSVARRTCRLASAMHNCGIKPGDSVVIMGPNHLDLTIPFYACHFGGHSICSIDPIVAPEDLIQLFSTINPKMVFCQKSCEDKVKKAYKMNKQSGEIVIFDDKTADLEAFVRKCNGTQVNYRPPVIDQAKTNAWLMLTSGTTGIPKVAMIPFETLLNGLICWWAPFPAKLERCVAMASIQWFSSLIYFSSTPLRGFTRVQSSERLTPENLIALINKYKPNVTAWTPFLLAQFLAVEGNRCDLSCFTYIGIGGSAIEKPLYDAFRKKCSALMYLIYGMTELLVPVFSYDENTTPFGSAGKPLPKYKYRLMDENNQPLYKPFKTGELWIKGDDFFKGYLNNPEETALMLTNDGWFKTGDMFYKDDQDYYFYVERKRLLIRHYGFQLSPLQFEEVIKQHPGVADACVVGIPDPHCLELPIGAVEKRNGCNVEAQEIFDLIAAKLPETKKLAGGIFFVDSFPVTPSGKIHRSKVRDLAFAAQRILPK